MIQVQLRSTFAVGKTQDRGGDSLMKGERVRLPEGATVKDLLLRLDSGGPEEEWDDIMLHAFVNGTHRGYDYVLQEGDVIDLHIPVSGG